MTPLLLLLIAHLAIGDRIVTTNSGPIKGTPVAGKKVEAFLGVPYAEPPLGERRFLRPVPKTPWENTYEANKLPPACIQAPLKKIHFPMDTNFKTSEDCLFLNLWVPEGGSDLKPVLLFIHGGGYMIGSSIMELYDGATLSEHGDVIVATINYRVGTLGFFSGFIDEAAGNMGMYDQVMAIQWVKDNAKHFGGDPDNIVLFGESAGAFSVSLHMVSPLSKNLFKRAILQSGSAYHPMYSDDNMFSRMGSQAIATMLGCADDDEALQKNPKEVVDCMKRLPSEKIAETDLIFLQTAGMLIPRVGDDFLPESPIDLYRKGDFKENEVMMGVTQDEGPLLLVLMRNQTFGVFGEKVDGHTFNETSAKEFLHALIKMDDGGAVFETYFDRVKESSRYTYLNAVSDVFGDFMITCGAVYQADYQSLKNIPVYFYLFDYRTRSTTLADWIGVAHLEEIQYVFGIPMYAKFSEYEEEFSKDIMDMWIAFAKTGNPNIRGGVEWPRYTMDEPKYYILSQRDGVGLRPDNYRCESWRNIFHAVVSRKV